MDSRTYETLATLPLFMGMSGDELVEVISHEGVTIETLEAGETFVFQGDSCAFLPILMHGEMRVTTMAAPLLSCEERMLAPFLLECDVLYGVQRTWSSSFSALTSCQLLLVSKQSVSRLMARSEIFRINYLNALSSLSVRRRAMLWAMPALTPRMQLLQFLLAHTILPQRGEKRFSVSMSHLALCLGMTRKKVGALLAELQHEGLLSYGRSSILIPNTEPINQTVYGNA